MDKPDRDQLEFTIREQELEDRRRQRSFDRRLVQQRFAMEQAQHFWRLAITSFSVMFGFIPILLIVGRDTIEWSRLVRLAAILFVAWFVAAFLPTMGIVNYFLQQRQRLHTSRGMKHAKNLGAQISLLWIIPVSLALAAAIALALWVAPLQQNESPTPIVQDASCAEVLEKLNHVEDALRETTSKANKIYQALSKPDDTGNADGTENGRINPVIVRKPPEQIATTGTTALDAIIAALRLAGIATDVIGQGTSEALSWTKILASLPPKAAEQLTEGFAHKAGEELAEHLFGRASASPSPITLAQPVEKSGAQMSVYVTVNGEPLQSDKGGENDGSIRDESRTVPGSIAVPVPLPDASRLRLRISCPQAR